MSKIIAIGGGEIRENETFEIDAEIIKLSEKENPKLLFIPTASYDSSSYLKMMKIWRFLGVDTMLKNAKENGTILCGISAGAIFWFKSGHSDSLSSYNEKKWKYITVKGLNFVNAILCPHYDTHTLGKSRKKHFEYLMKKLPKNTIGIGIDENCAIEFVNNKYRVLSSKKSAKAYKIFWENSKIISKEIIKTTELQDITSLL